MRLAHVSTKSTMVYGYFVIGTEALNEDGAVKSIRKIVCQSVKEENLHNHDDGDDGDDSRKDGLSDDDYLEEEESAGVRVLKEEAIEGTSSLSQCISDHFSAYTL
jgi:hypothetical protein